jgi:hypothetical protein
MMCNFYHAIIYMFKFLTKYTILILMVLVPVLFSCQMIAKNSNAHNSFQVWEAPSLEYVSREVDSNQQFGNFSQQTKEKPKEIQLRAARGEYESFQIVIQSPEGSDLNNVNLIVSDLRNAKQGTIGYQNITLYREHYVYVDMPSPDNLINNPTLGKDWYPDGLIPFVNPATSQDLEGANLDAVPFDLEKNENQPIWVDIYVPRDAAPGEYKGSYTVTTDKGEKKGQINLTVWDFELPVKPTIHSFFNPWQNRGTNMIEELLKHKVMPGKFIQPEQQTELINKWGLTSVRLPFFSGANYKTCTMSPAPRVEEIKQASVLYNDKLLKYIYSADEVDKCPQIAEAIKQWGENIHQAGIKNLVVMAPRPDLYDYVDIWIIDPRRYQNSKAKIAKVMKQGKEVWFYPGYNAEYSPQWTIDSLPINFRIPQGFIAQSLNLKGILYAQIDAWADDASELPLYSNDPWNKPSVYQQGKRHFSGEGMLIYPGEEVGVDGIVPSIRLKRIRDGIDDYDYIAMLKKLGEEDWALNMSRSIARNWHKWTQNPEELEQVRVQLGDRIQELTQKKNNDSKNTDSGNYS